MNCFYYWTSRGVWLAALFALCAAAVSCSDDEAPDKPVPAIVSLEEGTVSEHSISFKLTPSDALAAYYAVFEEGQPAPSAEQLFDPEGGGIPADPTVSRRYVADNLAFNTRYTIVAAARNVLGYSELATISMRTAAPVPTLTLAAGNATAYTLTFDLTPVHAGRVAYACVKKGDALPDAEAVFARGTEVAAAEAGTYTVAGLEPDTEYRIVAAAYDLPEETTIVSEPLDMATGSAKPNIGDFYYSDGTWSSELDASKTPIGIVFYLGAATEFGDSSDNYFRKDGTTPLGEVNGYALALHIASDAACWSFYDSWGDAVGCSTDKNDFLGYGNTQTIVSEAAKTGGLTDSESDNWPAAYFAVVDYEKKYPAPAASSGWFLPSAGQLKYIFDTYFDANGRPGEQFAAIYEALGDKASTFCMEDSKYWSSTEAGDTQAYLVDCATSSLNTGRVSATRKGAGTWYQYYVRSVLVF